jgi:hypothetical protein
MGQVKGLELGYHVSVVHLSIRRYVKRSLVHSDRVHAGVWASLDRYELTPVG